MQWALGFEKRQVGVQTERLISSDLDITLLYWIQS